MQVTINQLMDKGKWYISECTNRIHSFFKCTWKLPQDKSHKRFLKFSEGSFENWNHIEYLFSECKALRLQIDYKNITAKYKHKKSKQHITKQPMDHWNNQRGNRYLETNEKEINNSNLWETTKLVLKGKFTVIHANHSKQEISQMYNLTLYSKEQE